MAGKWVLSFDGINDDVDCGSNASLNSPATIEALVKTSASNRGAIFDKLHPSSYKGYTFEYNQSGTKKIDFFPTVGAWSHSNSSINDGLWHHVAVVLNGINSSFYIDTNSNGSFSSVSIQISSVNAKLGQDYLNNDFLGFFAYIRVWNNVDISRLLTYAYRQINSPQDSLVLNLRMNEGAGDYAYDASGYNNHGYLGNGTPDYKPTWTWVTDCPLKKGRIAPLGRGLAGADMIEGLAL